MLFFPKPCSDRTRVNSFKLNEGEFRFDLRRKYFTVRVAQNCNCASQRTMLHPKILQGQEVCAKPSTPQGWNSCCGGSLMCWVTSQCFWPECLLGASQAAAVAVTSQPSPFQPCPLGLALPFPLSWSCLCRDERFCDEHLVPKIFLRPIICQSGPCHSSDLIFNSLDSSSLLEPTFSSQSQPLLWPFPLPCPRA